MQFHSRGRLLPTAESSQPGRSTGLAFRLLIFCAMPPEPGQGDHDIIAKIFPLVKSSAIAV